MTPWVQRLLIANIGMFFLQLTVPGVEDWLAFVPMLVLSRPWSVVTYMFLHDRHLLTHILFNLIALYFFGPRVESRIGSQRFIVLYLLSGVSGALLSFLFAPYAQIIGASAAVFGVMLGFALFWPRERLYIWGVLPIEARWLVVISTVLALYSGFRGSTGGVADFAHLGGYAGAFLYLKWLERISGARRFSTHAVASVPDKLLGKWREVDPRSVHEVNREEVNRILDKISAKGLGSLTPKEKLFLSNFVPLDDRKPPAS